MTKRCHRFDTKRVHYYVRSSRLPGPEGVLLSRVSHPNPIYDLGWPQRTDNPVLSKNKSIQMKDSSGEGTAKTKVLLKNT